ncbi:hypothetical protein HOLleu_27992 [Holothuria leucospilota]|uniref:PHD-type domain-containing protein n=1 Tax=Holothuria leucospilota TaxID=206669 RepID=A0A9Q1H3M8_HOLLE|nr:hypothetical protein HOLleu_27992 [Holothuria leucospilota]
MCLLLILGGDIEVNPGPGFYCGVCSKLVKKRDKAVECDGCVKWVHTRCASIDNAEYKLLQLSNPNDKWYCPNCSSPCGICAQMVLGTDPAIECDSCKNWIHNRCSQVDDIHYHHIQATNCVWICPTCSQSNLTTTFIAPFSQNSNPNVGLNHNGDQNVSVTLAETPSRSKHIPGNKTAHKKEISLVSININGIRGKKLDLQAFLSVTEPDVVALQETKVDDSITTSELFPSCLDYTIFRNDRTLGGGGTMLLVKNNLTPSRVSNLTDGSESIWAKFSINGTMHYVASWYRDPDAPSEHTSLLREQLSKIMANHKTRKQPCFHILGDFNFSRIDWLTRLNKDSGLCLTNSSGKLLLDIINDFAADQLVNFATRGDNTLDLLITNSPSQYIEVSPLDPFSDHEALFCRLKCLLPNIRQSRRLIWQFSKGDYSTMRRDTRTFALGYFNGGQNNRSIDENWQLLKSFLERTVKKNVPTKLTRTRTSLPWVNDGIRKLIRRRDKLHAIFKKTRKNNIHDKWVELRKKVKREVYISHTNYINGMTGDIKNDTKPFWKYINGQKKDKHSIPPLQTNGKLAITDLDKALAFNSQFTSVFTKTVFSIIPFRRPSGTRMADISISTHGVEKLLKGLNKNKAVGPDNIHPWVLREIASDFAPMLSHLYQQSLSSGRIPVDWKRANVCPIYKKK